ncbi:nucleoside phosphorylase domain-containing protein [Globomyces pollinis-pini]|nr:nucleoside phosphorylase domain-containing protein [Globomyces pollinis-pini]KAJ2996017.1 hypothetical protein HDV02_000246 [Globomyces sp. JEL0801]
MASSNNSSYSVNYFDYNTYSASVDYLRSHLPPTLQSISLGVVCGSGLGGLVDCFDADKIEFNYADIPHFPHSTVQGHAGKFVFGTIAGVPTVCMLGRMHVYEGHSPVLSVFPIRIMKLLGATNLIVTNAAGGLNKTFNVGDFMIIGDHVSLAGMGGQNALIGHNIDAFGPRFPPVSDAYDFDLRVKAAKAGITLNLGSTLREGVYTFVCGPSFETRAEARFLRDGCHGDCVGMSTVPEVVVAKHAGMKVLGLTLITNKVSVGYGRSPIEQAKVELGLAPANQHTLDDELQLASHAEVLETSKHRSVVFCEFVKTIIQSL